MENGLKESRNKLKFLKHVGLIVGIVAAVAYIILCIVMITGLSADLSMEGVLLFLAIGAVATVIMMFGMMIEGQDLAKKDYSDVVMEYSRITAKVKKSKEFNLTKDWAFDVIKSIVLKVGVIFVQMAGILYLAFMKMADWGLLLTAITNVAMAAGFGLLSLNSRYEKYEKFRVPQMEAYIEEYNKDNERSKEEANGRVQPSNNEIVGIAPVSELGQMQADGGSVEPVANPSGSNGLVCGDSVAASVDMGGVK